MTLFEYTAVRGSGEKNHGALEASDKLTLIAMLRREGWTPLSVDVASHGALQGQRLRVWFFSFLSSLGRIFTVPNAEKILFARNLAAMSSAGLPLSRSITILERQTRNSSMKKTLTAISDDIKQGHTLHDALAQHPNTFSPLFIAMTRAGEESGTLSQSLQIVATQMERSLALTKKVHGAMIYPGIIITVMLAIGALMLIYVVPTLAQTFASLGSKLPAPTQFIIGLSNAVSTHTLLILGSVIGVVVGVMAIFRTTGGKKFFDHAITRIPIIGNIVIKLNAARTARTLASLLSAGIPALTALSITHDVVQNSRFRPVINEAHDLVEKGKAMSEAFIKAEKIYPIIFSEMAAVGEETGDVAGMLTRVADFYEGEVEQHTKDLSTVIEPFLMVIIGLGVGFFAISMIMPIYSLSSSI